MACSWCSIPPFDVLPYLLAGRPTGLFVGGIPDGFLVWVLSIGFMVVCFFCCYDKLSLKWYRCPITQCISLALLLSTNPTSLLWNALMFCRRIAKVHRWVTVFLHSFSGYLTYNCKTLGWDFARDVCVISWFEWFECVWSNALCGVDVSEIK